MFYCVALNVLLGAFFVLLPFAVRHANDCFGIPATVECFASIERVR